MYDNTQNDVNYFNIIIATRSSSTNLRRYRSAILGGGRAEQLGITAKIKREEEAPT